MANEMLAQTLLMLRAFGLDPIKFIRAVRGIPTFLATRRKYSRLVEPGKFPLKSGRAFPCLSEFESAAGDIGGHYFHQDLWAARRKFERRPVSHFDVGSRIDGFVAHLLAFMPVTLIDLRKLDSQVSGMTFIQADATDLYGIPDRSLCSLSSLHAVEHFGLGRYGDPVNPKASFSAMAALSRVLAPGGRLYFGIPVGRERLEFNAHRIFSPTTIIDSFPDLRLEFFSAVDDQGQFHCDAAPLDFAEARFACGLFEFVRPYDSVGAQCPCSTARATPDVSVHGIKC